MFDLLTDCPATAENTRDEARAKLIAVVAPVIGDPFYNGCDRIVAVFGADCGDFFGHHFTRADLEEITASLA